MKKLAMYTYNGYKITVRPAPDGLSGQVDVFDPRFLHNPSLYRTTSIDLASKWIDAYRDGQQWAVNDVRKDDYVVDPWRRDSPFPGA
jgi:hypothetical protein